MSSTRVRSSETTSLTTPGSLSKETSDGRATLTSSPAQSIFQNSTAQMSSSAISYSIVTAAFFPPITTVYTNPAAQPYSNDTFPFLIPFGIDQLCDIFGPTCQAGSIAVPKLAGSNLTSTVTLACSSYLSSQSSYLFYNAKSTFLSEPVLQSEYPQDWAAKFGRSPQCTSYQQRWSAAESESSAGPWTFSECSDGNSIGALPINTSLNLIYPTQVPPGAALLSMPDCCNMDCLVDVPSYRLYYFADPKATARCRSNETAVYGLNSRSGLGGSMGSRSGFVHAKRAADNSTVPASHPVSMTPASPDGSTTVVSGHTLFVLPS